MKAEAGAGFENTRTRADQTSNTTFGQEGQGLLDTFLLNQGLKKNAQGVYEQAGQNPGTTQRQSTIDSLAGGGTPVDKNALLDAIRKQSDAQTQVDIAQGRSKFYNKPTGRNDINLADTVSRNAAVRDTNLANTGADIDKFNAQLEQQRRIQAAQNALQLSPEAQGNQQILQALQILAGKQTSSLVDSDKTNVDTKFTGNLFGGICWVAREVYGETNPAWLSFRAWLYTKAPVWFFNLYLNNGERFALYIKNKPKTKRVVKLFMDLVR